MRYGSIGGLEYEVPPVPVVLSVYQRGCLLDGLAMYLSCDTKKFHDNESTHILHNFWTSTHRGEASPFPPWWRHWSQRKTKRPNAIPIRNLSLTVILIIIIFPSPTLSFIPDLKPSLFCKSFPPQPFFFFFRTDYMYVIPQTFTVTSD